MLFSRYAIWLGLLIFGCLSAEGDKGSDFYSLASPLAEPSCIVDGHVNVITGDFIDCESDMNIPAPEDFQVQRSYNSRGSSDGFMGWGWYSNHDCSLKSEYLAEGDDKQEWNHAKKLTLQAPMGFVVDFGVVDDEGNYEKRKAPASFFSMGVTNTSQGIISAQTNPKEITYQFPGKIAFGDGRLLSFSIDTYDYRPTGNSFTRTKLQAGRKITFANRHGHKQGFVDYIGHPIHTKQFDRQPFITAVAPDGRSVHYNFLNFDLYKNERIHLLNSVDRSDKPFVRYDWDTTPTNDGRRGQRQPKICQIRRPNDRRLYIHYANVGANEILGEQKVLKPSSWRVGYVLRLFEPLGKDNTLVPKYHFKYTRGDNGGYTSVYDALLNRTDYHYTREARLNKIIKYREGKQPYSTEQLFWGGAGGPEETFLKSRCFGEADLPSLHFCKLYHYDKRGNVLKEELFGNFTGTNTTPLQVDGAGNPLNRSVDTLVSEYKYSKDGFNLLLSESCNGIKKKYSYLTNTNLLASCLHKAHHQVFLRHFYTHDAAGQVIEHIEDDGITENKDDLTGVTERRIQRVTYTSSYPFGLAQETIESYLDLATGKESQLLRLVKVHDAQGRVVKQLAYGADNQHFTTEEWQYDLHSNLLSYTNPLGQTTTYTYDENDNCLTETGPDPLFTKLYQYDYMNRRISTEYLYDGESFSEKTSYNLLSQVVEKVNIDGHATNYTYDPFGRPIECIAPVVLDLNGVPYRPVTKTKYNALGYPIEITDAVGNTTSSCYTLFGSPYKVTHPDGSEDRFEYDLEGRLVKSISRTGSVTCYTLDHLGRPTCRKVYDANGALLLQSEAGYNTFHLLWEKDALGVLTTHHYDGAGRKIREECENKITEYHYNAQGLIEKTTLRSSTDASDGSTQAQIYDIMQRPIEERIETLEGDVLTRSTYTYDHMGNKTTITQETDAGKSTTYIKYGAFNIPIERHDPDGTVTKIAYKKDATSTIETIDPTGQISLQVQDALERIIETSKKDAFGKELQKTKLYFDAMSRCVQTTHIVYSPNKETREVVNKWVFDSMGRTIEQIEAAGTSEEKRTSTRYNLAGLKEAVIKPDGVTINYLYDPLGRLQSQFSSDHHYQYQYDANSQLTEIKDLFSNKRTLCTYDALGRLIAETMDNGFTLNRTYRIDGSLASLKLENGSRVLYHYNGPQLTAVERVNPDGTTAYIHRYRTYDLTGRLLKSSLIHDLGELNTTYTIKGEIASLKSPYLSETLERDTLGNITKQTLNDQENQFTYDSLNQLTSETGSVNNSYSNDSLNNRISKNGAEYALNALNQLLNDGEYTYTYDPSGNLTQAAGKTYLYDTLNRLIETQEGNQKTTYHHDACNRCTERLHYTDQTLTKTEKVLFLNQSEIGVADETKLHTFRTLGKGLRGEIGGAIAVEISGNVYAPLHDHMGNVTSLVDKDGHLAASYRYSAFGELEVLTGSNINNPWKFSSKYQENGLVHYGLRVYSPKIGRFLTKDPAGYSAGPNPYAFVLNNPLNRVDLFGLKEESLNLYDRTHDHHSWEYHENRDRQNRRDRNEPYDGPTIAGCAQVARHLLPVPIAQDIVCGLLHLIANGNLDEFNSWKDCRTTIESLKLLNRQLHIRHILFTGINTSNDQAIAFARVLSKLFGGENVIVVHNGDHGTVADLAECGCLMLDISLHSTEMSYKALKDLIKELGGPGSGGILNVVCFSQGALTFSLGAQQLTREERAMMHVNTYGPATILEKGDFMYVKNSISTRDPVTFLGSPIRYILARLGFNPEVEFLSARETTWGFDHSFMSKTYQTQMKLDADQFMKEHYK